jgi:hypothetical protein
VPYGLPDLVRPLWERAMWERFIELSFEIERHSRGQLFETAMRTFPTEKFHEWCELSKKLQERIEGEHRPRHTWAV